MVISNVKPWAPAPPWRRSRASWKNVGFRQVGLIDQALARPELPANARLPLLILKATVYNYEGQPRNAYQVLAQARALHRGRRRPGGEAALQH